MKSLFIALGFALPGSLALAQELGTKPDLSLGNPTSFSAPNSVMPLVQLAVVVGIIVLALKCVLPRMLPMINKKLNPSLGSRIKIEESASFAGGTLYIVSVGDQSALLSVSSQGVQKVMNLGGKEVDAEPAFFEHVDKRAEKPIARAAVVLREDPDAIREPKPAVANTMSPDQAAIALDRLKRLIGGTASESTR